VASDSLDPQTLTVTIPLVVTVRVGAPVVGAAMQVEAPAPRRAPVTRAPSGGSAPAPSPVVVHEETVSAEDYRDRKGYDPDFLGKDFTVPLPRLTRDRRDLLTFDDHDGERSDLRYHHFSVVMSRARRMCRFSAVNIHGKHSKPTERSGWRRDPRIAADQQVIDECYGRPPKFSRGHMTRREDPAWGDAELAQRGSNDSMHVTNVTPQMQAFNSPIWLELEDYALQTARREDMKISVFTGPFFSLSDPTIDGVRIPPRFWKVIAFVDTDSRSLCATGYVMEQDEQLPAEEGVFGDFVSSHLRRSVQVPITEIERDAGLSFGPLAACDPLARAEESLGDVRIPLLQLEQIRFR
jgi:endonuclease G